MKKIMIVEDSNLMIAVITNFIKKGDNEFEVISAKGGDEAIKTYKEQKPDLVFMDIKMPGIDGITALEKIREFDSNAKVIMCTSLKETAHEERAMKAGAIGYIKKPFSKKDILDALQKN